MRPELSPLRPRTLCVPLALAASLLAGIVAGLARPADAAAPVVITTGREGGSYFYIGRRFKTEVIVRYDTYAEVLTSRGSLHNLARLADPESPANVALTQADALRQYLAEHPDFTDAFFVLGDVGDECAFLVTGRAVGIETAADLKRQVGAEVSVDAATSGAAVTLNSIKALDPDYAVLAPSYVRTTEALLQLKAGTEFTKLRAAMFVQRPRLFSPLMRLVVEALDVYRFIPIREGDLRNATLPDGRPVYSFERVSVGGKEHAGTEVETLCTRGLLLGAKQKLSGELREKLSTLMLKAGDRVVGKLD